MPITPTPASCVACGGGGEVTDVCVVCPVLVPSDHAEDSVHVSGDTGSFILTVRNDDADILTDANGDYAPLSTNSRGAIYVTSDGNSPPVTVTGSVTAVLTPVTTTSHARLLTDVTPWTPADVTSGALRSVRFQVLTGTATVVDSSAVATAGIAVGTVLEWSIEMPNVVTGPNSVTPSVGGTTLATWVEGF